MFGSCRRSNLIEELGVHCMGPYWQDEQSFSKLARILAFVCNDDTEPPQARTSKTHAQAVAPSLVDSHGAKWDNAMPGHSDAIVVVDPRGNVAAIVHSINTVLWGDTGLVVGGVPISDAGGFGPEQFASKKPGDRISDGMQSTITIADGKPILATGRHFRRVRTQQSPARYPWHRERRVECTPPRPAPQKLG
jgi:gamma-glutamyltranspeptidase/glutathione hydrolase